MPIRQVLVFTVEDGDLKAHRQDVRGLERDHERLQKETDDTARKSSSAFGRIGNAASRWIKGVAVGAFTALAAAMYKGTTAAVDFERGMAEVGTLVDDATVNIDDLGESLRRIAERSPVALGDLTKGLYQVISAGVPAAEAIKVLDAATAAAVGGATDVATTIDGLTTILNGYGLSADQVTKVSDAMFIAMRNGKTTIEELSSRIGTAVPIANSLGVSYEELLSAVSALTTAGYSTSEAVTGIRSALGAVARQGAQAVETAQELGLEFNQAAISSKGLAGFLAEVTEKAGGSTEVITDLFESVEATGAVLALGGQQAERFGQNLEDMASSAGATTDAFDKMQNTVSSQWRILKNQLNEAFMRLGEKILPTVSESLSGLIAVMNRFSTTAAERMLRRVEELGDKVSEQLKFDLSIRVQRQQIEKELESIRDDIDRSGSFTLGVNFAGLQEMGVYLSAAREDLRKIVQADLDTISGIMGELSTAEVEAIERVAAAQERHREATYDIFGRRTDELGTEERRLKLIQQSQDQLQSLLVLKEKEAVAEAELEDLAERRAKGYKIIQQEANEAAEAAKRASEEEARVIEQRQQAAEQSAFARKFKEARAAADEFFGSIESSTIESRSLASVVEQILDTHQMLARAQEQLPYAKNREQAEGMVDALRDQLRQLEAQRDRMLEQLEAGKELANIRLEPLALDFDAEAWQGTVSEIMDAVGRATDALAARSGGLGLVDPERVKRDVDASAAELARLVQKIRQQFAGSAIPDAIKPGLDAIVSALKAMGAEGQAVLESLGLEKTKADIESVEVSLDDVTDALRSLQDAGRVFGILGDDARDFVGGLINVLDNVDKLKAGISALSAGGSLLNVIVPGLGVAAGLASSIGGLLSGRNEEAERAQQENTRALKENAERVTEAIDRLTSQLQSGADTPGVSADALKGLVQQLISDTVVDPFNPLIGAEDRAQQELDEAIRLAAFTFTEGSDRYYEAVRRAQDKYDEAIADARRRASDALGSFFDNLDDLDLGSAFDQDAKDALRALAETMLKGGATIGEVFDAILSGTEEFGKGLNDIIDELENTGAFGDSIEAAIAKLRLLVDLGAVSPEDAINKLVETILAGDTQLSDGLRGFLEGIDTSTEEGRQALRDAIAGLISTITQGGDAAAALLGEQTPETIQDLLRELLGLIQSEVTTVASEFSNPLEDAANALRIFRTLLEGDVSDALRMWASKLLEEGALSDPRLVAIAEAIKATGAETEADRKRIDELIKIAAQGLFDGESFDGMTPDQVEAFLIQAASLLDQAEAEAQQDDGYSSSVQIARTITDVQGNEVIIRLSELRYLAEERNALLEQLVAMGQPFAYDVAVLPNQSAVTNIDVGGVNIYASPSIDEISEALAEQIREALVEAYPNG